MKQIVYLFITVVISLGVLTACGQGDEPEQDNSGDNTGETTEETDQAEDQGQSENQEDGGSSENTANEGETDVEQEDTVETESSEDSVTETVTLYFSDEQLLEKYTEEQEVKADSEEAIPAAALQAWIDGPEHAELVSHFQNDVEVQSVEETDSGVAKVSFSSSFMDTNAGSSAEMAITEQIALIMKQFGYEETKILIDGEEEASLFGHMDASEPFSADNADEYEPIE